MLSHVLFEFLGIEWTWLTVITFLTGAIPTLIGLYKLYDHLMHREERRIAMLHKYLDNEEKDISAKRKPVLDSIRLASQSYLTEREFDVGREIDHAIIDLDGGHPELATAKLEVLEKRLEKNEELLRKRADHLEKHRASVRIFLAALADKCKRTDLGLEHIAKAIQYDNTDLDALKYQCILLLSKGDYGQAERDFNRLRTISVGPDNVDYKADAYLGLATIEFRREPRQHASALGNLDLALQNLRKLPPLKKDHYTWGQVHKMQGDIYADSSWSEHNTTRAVQCYTDAINALKQIPHNRPALDFEIEAIRAAQRRLQSLAAAGQSAQLNLLSQDQRKSQ